MRAISGQLKETSTKRDITFDALGGRWTNWVQASEVFGSQSGDYEFTFNCPGVGNSQFRVKYITDPAECDRQHAATQLTAGPSCNKKPTTDYGLSMTFENADGATLKRQRDCNYYLNTEDVTVVFDNKDISRGSSDLGQCWIDSKQKLGASARRGAVIATGKLTGAFTGKTWLPGDALDPLTQEFQASIENSIWNVGKEDVEFLYTCEDVAGTKKETYTETVILDPSLSNDQVGGTVTGAGTFGTQPATTGSITGTVNRQGNYTAVVRLSYPQSAGIAKCVVDFGDGQTGDVVGTSGGTVTHTYPSTQASYQLTYYCSDFNQTLVEEKQFASFATPASTAVAPPAGALGGGANNPPSVQISSPTSLSFTNTGAMLDVSGTVTDPNSGDTIDKVEVDVEDMSTGVILVSKKRATVTGNNWQANVQINEGGAYKIKVSAFDNRGAQNIQTVEDILVVDPSKPVIVINQPKKSLSGSTATQNPITLDFDILNFQMGTITYEINWGDGQKTNGDVSITSLSTPMQSARQQHNYGTVGSKTITIRATDSRNIQATETLNIIAQ